MIGAGPSESTAQPPFRHSLRTRRFDPKATFKIGPMTAGRARKRSSVEDIAVAPGALVSGHARPKRQGSEGSYCLQPVSRRPGAGIGSPATGKKALARGRSRECAAWEGARPLRRSDCEQGMPAPAPSCAAANRSERLVFSEGDAVHQAFAGIIVERVMLGRAIVPDRDGVDLPTQLQSDFRPIKQAERQSKQGVAFPARNPLIRSVKFGLT